MSHCTRWMIWTAMGLAASPLLAQPNGGRAGQASMTIYQVAMTEAVQKELALMDEQKAKLQALSQEIREALGAPAGGEQNLSDDERARRRVENRKKLELFRPKLAEILSAAQGERLQQITWQNGGPLALEDSELARKLNLTKDQREKITASIRSHAEKTRRSGSLARVQELRVAREAEVMGLLTEEQKSTFEKLKGKSFDVSRIGRE